MKFISAIKTLSNEVLKGSAWQLADQGTQSISPPRKLLLISRLRSPAFGGTVAAQPPKCPCQQLPRFRSRLPAGRQAKFTLELITSFKKNN